MVCLSNCRSWQSEHLKTPINIKSQPHPKTINDQEIVETKDKPLKELSKRIIVKNAQTVVIF